ncbi:MAG: glycosyltransferase [Clostridia bacterium]|nr:glycosyltransferase [Clostridia bacterium]
MKKKIALFISTLNSGGAERVVSHLSKILSVLYDVHIILYEDVIEYEYEGTLHILNVPATAKNGLSKVRLLLKRVKKLKKLIKNEKIDCIISFLDSPNFVNLLTKSTNCKRIISIRNYSKRENKKTFLGKLTDFFIKRLYRKADYIVTVSELIKQSYIKEYKLPKKKIVTIYNPYNFNEIDEKSIIPLKSKEENFYYGNFVFINVGRIMYQKGIWHLLKAFLLVYKRYKNVRLVLVGEDLSNGKVMRFIEQAGLEDIVLLTGRTKNPYQYLKNSNCYVLSSLFEGFPNAMVEAMACGCTIIAADCKSGPKEILCKEPDLFTKIDKTTIVDFGIMVPDLEPEENWDLTYITEGEKELAEAMIFVLDKSEETEKLINLAKKRSYDFSFDKCKEEYFKIIDN